MGHGFRLRAVPESVSHSGAEFRDAVSAEVPSGNRVPLRASILGWTFRQKVQPETASHSEAKFWDAVSG